MNPRCGWQLADGCMDWGCHVRQPGVAGVLNCGPPTLAARRPLAPMRQRSRLGRVRGAANGNGRSRRPASAALAHPCAAATLGVLPPRHWHIHVRPPLSASCLRGIGTSMCGRKREARAPLPWWERSRIARERGKGETLNDSVTLANRQPPTANSQHVGTFAPRQVFTCVLVSYFTRLFSQHECSASLERPRPIIAV
jgi:hypothetical protein